MNKTITIRFYDEERPDLEARAKYLNEKDPRVDLSAMERSIHFLRGVFSRATMCLPAYYYFLGSISSPKSTSEPEYFRDIARAYSEFADLSTLTLSCRKVFDDSTKSPLTGKRFSTLSDIDLAQHAEYWSSRANRNLGEAEAALCFLRRFFKECSKPTKTLLSSTFQLQKRIGLMKQHADRSAAHLTLQNFSLTTQDLTHFVAAMVVVAEVIRSFDKPELGPRYFNQLDDACFQAAEHLFPKIIRFQLFRAFDVSSQSRLYWQMNPELGLHMLYEQIHLAIGGTRPVTN